MVKYLGGLIHFSDDNDGGRRYYRRIYSEMANKSDPVFGRLMMTIHEPGVQRYCTRPKSEPGLLTGERTGTLGELMCFSVAVTNTTRQMSTRIIATCIECRVIIRRRKKEKKRKAERKASHHKRRPTVCH